LVVEVEEEMAEEEEGIEGMEEPKVATAVTDLEVAVVISMSPQ